MTSSYKGDPMWITARFNSQCDSCGETVHKGDRAFYYPRGKKVYGSRCDCGERNNADFVAAVQDEDFYNGVNY